MPGAVSTLFLNYYGFFGILILLLFCFRCLVLMQVPRRILLLSSDFIEAVSDDCKLINLCVFLRNSWFSSYLALFGLSSRSGSLAAIFSFLIIFPKFILDLMLLLLLFLQLLLGFSFVFRKLFSKLLLPLPDLIKIKGYVTFLTLVVLFCAFWSAGLWVGYWLLFSLCAIFSLTITFRSSIKSLLRCLLELSEIHLGSFWVFFKNAIVGFLPFA